MALIVQILSKGVWPEIFSLSLFYEVAIEQVAIERVTIERVVTEREYKPLREMKLILPDASQQSVSYETELRGQPKSKSNLELITPSWRTQEAALVKGPKDVNKCMFSDLIPPPPPRGSA